MVDDSTLANEAAERLSEHRLLGLVHQPFESERFAQSVMRGISESDAKQVDAIFASSVSEPTALAAGNTPIGVPEPAASAVGSPVRSDWTKPVGLVAIAASILLALGVATKSWGPSSSPSLKGEVAVVSEPAPKAVGTVILSENCQWESDLIDEGSRLLEGPLRLRVGLAVIRFDGGAELILQDDTELQLLSVGTVKVNHGNIVVRAVDSAVGFRVITPASEVIDLGTEFSVKVSERGETQLEVLEGEVSVRPLDVHPDRVQVLTEGNSVVVDDAKSEPRNTELQAERFDALIAKARPKSRADLMYAYEGFFYDEGELALEQSTRGKGWVGPWRKRTDAEGAKGEPDTGTSDALRIVHGQMNVTWPVPGGRLGMLQFPPGKSFRIREMRRPIDLGRDGIYYFSLMVRESDISERPSQARPQESMRLTFRSEEAYFDESLSFQISLKRTPQIQTGLGVGFASAAESSPDQTTLWIGKIVARENGEDEVSFRVFAESDELTYAEPAVWHVVSRNLDLSAKLNLVLLTSTGTTPRIVDELRIGPTWRSVTPMLDDYKREGKQ